MSCNIELLLDENPFLEWKNDLVSALYFYSDKIDDYLVNNGLNYKENCGPLVENNNKLSKSCHDKSSPSKTKKKTPLLCITFKCALSRKIISVNHFIHPSAIRTSHMGWCNNNETERFYVFPSGFVVLESALKAAVKPYLNKHQKLRLRKVDRQLLKSLQYEKQVSAVDECRDDTTFTKNNDMDSINEKYRDERDRPSNESTEYLQSKIDDLIASDCPLTGNMMIQSVEEGFLCGLDEDEEYESLGVI